MPPNVRFEIDDAEDEWVYSYKFDYIHGRYICTFITDIPKLLRNIYDHLNPGGYVEIMETLMLMESIDNSLAGHALDRWGKLCREGMRRQTRSLAADGTGKWAKKDFFLKNISRPQEHRPGSSSPGSPETVDG